ncbi:hypothetical protein [Thalassobaculum sp.]|uniref:hypothetical protein n=1 Tax=Thalassobaculum sp. TaxID=2022740 RepID=UPI003B5B5BA3
MSDFPDNLAFPDRIDLTFVVEHEERYFRALGRFVHRYSAVEAIMHAYHAHLAGLTREMANAVFSGIRVRVARDNIRRMHAVKNKPLDPAYADVLEQLNIIAAVRDAVIHHGATFEDGKPKHVTNARRAHTEEATQSFPISADLLDAMSDDLDAILLNVQGAIWRDLLKPREHRMMFGDLQQPSWRYKHQPQDNRKTEAPRKRQAQRSRPKSSPE